VCDTLVGEHVTTESRAFLDRLWGTASQPIPLTGLHARAASLHHLLALTPVDLVSITCHGGVDCVFLADGPLRSEQIQGWTMLSRPIVLNNSCASWPTIGPAFVNAGARGYVGTLWPVKHRPATEVATRIGETVLANPAGGIGDALRAALENCAEPAGDDSLAYVFVGLPDVPARIHAVDDSIDRQDVAEFALLTAHSLSIALIERGELPTALRLRDALMRDLIARLEETLFVGGVPGHLRCFNRQAEHLPSIVATLETDFWRNVLNHAGPDSIPGGIDELLAKHETAIQRWEEGARKIAADPDVCLEVQETRLRIVSASRPGRICDAGRSRIFELRRTRAVSAFKAR